MNEELFPDDIDQLDAKKVGGLSDQVQHPR